MGPRLADLTTEGTPPCANDNGEDFAGLVFGADAVFTDHEGRMVRRRVQAIEEEEVAVTGKDRRDLLICSVSLSGQLEMEFLRSALELVVEHVRVARPAQSRAEPLEIVPHMFHPDRIEHDIKGAHVGAKPSAGHAGLMDVLRSRVMHRGTEPPVVVQESGETLRDDRRHHVPQRRVIAEPRLGRWRDGKSHGCPELWGGLGQEPRPLESSRHLSDDFGVGILELEFDLAKPEAVARATFHRDRVVIELGDDVV